MTSDEGFRLLPGVALLMSFGIAACAREAQVDADATGGSAVAAASGERAEDSGEHTESSESAESGEEGGGEHGEGEGADHEEPSGEGEESGEYIARADTWDATRQGARLVLSYNAQQGAFVGSVENTTDQRICAVRVEVHLGGGQELGPTPRTDVPAGSTIDVELATHGAAFEAWTAHPELSTCPGG